MKSFISDEIKSSLASLSTPSSNPIPSKKRKVSVISSSEGEEVEVASASSRQFPNEEPLSDGEILEEDKRYFFSANEMEELLRAVRSTMGIEDTPKPRTVQDKMFGGLRARSSIVFPINENIKEMILEEWSDPEKRLGVPKEFRNRLCFDPSESKIYNQTPKVDLQVTKVVKKTALPFEDSSQLGDPMDRKADGLLKKSWEAAMFGVKTNSSATSIARAMYIWLGELDEHLKNRTPREEIRESLPLLRSATAFLADASAESIRFSAKDAAFSNAARRALWMKAWSGDKASKAKLCSIPFSGEFVFGPTLDKILEGAADKKKGFPEDKEPKKKPFRQYQPQQRSYRGKGKSGRWSYPKGGRGRGFILNPQNRQPKQQ
ncbi:lamina-associated polypeptide 2, isoforms alpha/zeta-like [Bufo gargarizans]|uniref:lamina-associated polypeptide 2, isoforms alpha/zeta-like n=1 Tax=Bufo gargarizans TaxID=30331 RepID=UPI001CF0F33B|nr:lamina-associated polypeptide 2, isoforms alpha/zeta-like [Bufo gargarizans]